MIPPVGTCEADGNAAVGSTSLEDFIKSNRNKRPRNRKRGCGRFSLKGIDLREGISGRGEQYARLNCNCWDCSYCGPRKQRMLREAIGRWAEWLDLKRFLTLTMNPEVFLPEDMTYAEFKELHDDDCEKERLKPIAIRKLRDSFNKLRVYLGRRYGAIDFICILELHESGMPHLHLLVDRYIPVEWLRESWQSVGGGFEIKIKEVPVRKASIYVSKYLSKKATTKLPFGCRRITTSRSIKLLSMASKPQHILWKMEKRTIWDSLEWSEAQNRNVSNIANDSEGFLEKFTACGSCDNPNPEVILQPDFS